jgi:hypothetical protein
MQTFQVLQLQRLRTNKSPVARLVFVRHVVLFLNALYCQPIKRHGFVAVSVYVSHCAVIDSLCHYVVYYAVAGLLFKNY